MYTCTAVSLTIALNAAGTKVEFGKTVNTELGRLVQSLYQTKVPIVALFVGGRKELNLLSKEEVGLVVVVGVPGVGKTTLVSKFASTVASVKNRNVFWHVVRESDSFGYVLAKVGAFLETLGERRLLKLIQKKVSEESLLIEATAESLDRVRALVVFDDYHYCRDSGITHLLQRLSSSKLIKTVVISRTRSAELLVHENVNQLSLAEYTDAEAAELFKRSGLNLTKDEVSVLTRS
jgi:ATP/maltotriose-dependent transcriptional regulator MalT